jgi:flagellar hook-length control protein FliK
MTDAYQGSVAVGRDFNLIDLAQAAGADPQQAFVDAWLGRTVPAAARNAYEVRWQGADRSGLAAAATGNDQTPPPLTVTRADEPTQTEAARRLALLAALMGMAGEGEAGSDLENTEPRVREFLTQLARLPESAIARTEATSLPANAQITLQQLRQLLNDARRVVSETPPARADAQPRLSPAGLEPVAREQTGLNRLAEMQALFRAGDSAARIAPEMTRAVAFSQQLAVDQRNDPRSGSPARIDAQTAPLAALAAAAREPALPPAVQLPGQAGAGAGEMRAAAEQAMQRVVWMAARDQGVSQARLQLHPAHLGKIDIHLEVQGREASVVLNVSNAPVRETVEAMLPRLREQLEQQGINLGDASVFDSEPGDAGTEQQRSAFAAAGSETGGSEGDQLAVETELRSGGLGLLDAYA